MIPTPADQDSLIINFFLQQKATFLQAVLAFSKSRPTAGFRVQGSGFRVQGLDKNYRGVGEKFGVVGEKWQNVEEK